MKAELDIVFVQGDTDSVLAGALAAWKLHIRWAAWRQDFESLGRCGI